MPLTRLRADALMCCAVAAMAAADLRGAVASSICVDGFFDDWAGESPVALDPAGDGAAPFDLTRVFVRNEGTKLYLRFDASSECNLQSGSPTEPSLLINVDLPTGNQLRINCRARTITLLPAGTALTWPQIDYVSAPTHSSRDFEVRLNLAGVGVVAGDTVAVNFAGADALDAPMIVVLDGPVTAAAARRSIEPLPGTEFRIASLNTEQTGLTSTRLPRLQRLIDAVSADIYCFQEEYNSSSAAVRSAVTSVDPRENGAQWQVRKNNDCAIATWGALIGLPAYTTSYVAGVCNLGTDFGGAVAVLSIHPKCCGYIGSSEDAQRIQQTSDMIRTITELRSGALGELLEPYRNVPVIIMGDWNLVGSRTPLTMVEAPAAAGGLGLSWHPLWNLIGEAVQSWRDPNSNFCPGMLDLVTHSPEIEPKKSFLLDTAVLTEGELTAMGVLADDSAASDHLIAVTDFAHRPPVCPGDLNADLHVGLGDIAETIHAWGTVGIPGLVNGDANGDGEVGLNDVIFILGFWATSCAGA